MSITTAGIDPFILTVAAATTTTNTTNTTSPATTDDRIQQFNADLQGQVNSGVTVDGFGLNLVTTKVGGSINIFTNNGTVTTDEAVDALRLDGNGGQIVYAGSGTVANTNSGTGAAVSSPCKMAP